MEKQLAKQIKKYLQTVNRYLICKRETKKNITKQIIKTINDYYEVHPDCSFEDIKIFIGSPSKLSTQLMSAIDKHEVKDVKRARLIRLVVILSIIVLILIMLLIVFSHILSSGTGTIYKSGVIIK